MGELVVAKRRARVVSAAQVLMTVVLIGACMFSAPVLAGALAGTDTATAQPASRSLGLAANAPASPKVAASTSSSSLRTSSTPKRLAPVPAKVATARATYSSAPKTTTSTTTRSSTSELATAKAILAGMIAKHPILAGTTVSFGKTPGGYQAVAYYKSGRILISPTHTASLTRIITHECWHIIDWRDNGRLDWGEQLPPSGTDTYVR